MIALILWKGRIIPLAFLAIFIALGGAVAGMKDEDAKREEAKR